MAGGLAEFIDSILHFGKVPSELEKLITQSEKFLGAGASVPRPSFDPAQANAELKKVVADLRAGIDKMRKVVLERENDATEALNDVTEYRAKIAKSDFGLNPKDKADAKKIADARKLFDSYFKVRVDFWTKASSDLKQKSSDWAKVRVQ